MPTAAPNLCVCAVSFHFVVKFCDSENGHFLYLPGFPILGRRIADDKVQQTQRPNKHIRPYKVLLVCLDSVVKSAVWTGSKRV